jgi:hypothetical protein
MRTSALALVLLAACGQGDGPLFPLSGGGGGVVGGGGADANLADSLGAPGTIHGKVCVIADPRDPLTCSSSPAAGYLVTLDGNTATTASDGAFAIASPQGATPVWMVTGNGLATSLASFSATATTATLPVMKRDDFIVLENDNGVVSTAGYGDVFLHVTHANANVATVVAVATPTPLYAPQYDGTTSNVWQVTSTGSFGMVWLAQVPTGVGAFATVSTSLKPQGGTAKIVDHIPVGDGALTWVSVELP